jgi:TolA-binding protein
MEQSFEHIDLFEAYQQGTLTGKEQLDFEARLSYDQEFGDEFSRYKKLEEGIRQHYRNELKNKFNEIDKELENEIVPTTKSNVRKLYWLTSAVAASLIIGILLFNFYDSENKHSQLAEQYWPIEEGLPVKMSTKGIYDDAMNAYKQERWEEAENLLLTINSDTAYYYLGVINFEQQQYALSIDFFSQVTGKSDWFEQSEFRLALTYLKIEQVDKAKNMLNKIANNNALYSKQSATILKEL